MVMVSNANELVDEMRALRRKHRLAKLEVGACEQYLRELEHCKCSYSVVHRAETQLEHAKILETETAQAVTQLKILAADCISGIEDNCERAILMSVIVEGRSVKETAKAVHYALRTVYRMKDSAMLDLDVEIAKLAVSE